MRTVIFLLGTVLLWSSSAAAQVTLDIRSELVLLQDSVAPVDKVKLQSAQDATETFTDGGMPLGSKCFLGGKEYRCFNLEDYKNLLVRYEELKYQRAVNHKNEVKILTLQEVNTNLMLSLEASEKKYTLLSEDYETLFLKWKDENRLRLEAENTPSIGGPALWGLSAAGIALALVVGFVVGTAL